MAQPIDLAALERDLAAVGVEWIECSDRELEIELEVTILRIRDDGMVLERDGTDMTDVLLTIAKHVDPPAPSLGDMLRRAEVMGWRPGIKLMRDSRQWLAQSWTGPHNGSMGYNECTAETPEAAMAGLLQLIEGDGDGE